MKYILKTSYKHLLFYIIFTSIFIVSTGEKSMSQDRSAWERPYLVEKGEKPFLFYTVFGVTPEDLKPSRSKHNVDSIPEGLDANYFHTDKHKDYISGFYSDYFGKILKEKDIKLYQKVVDSQTCMVIQGEIENSETLEYLKNAIGLVQCLSEKDAIAILDMHTLTWYYPKEWSDKFFKSKPYPRNQIVTLYSKENNGYWYHTRGMIKFGRPDISIVGVSKNEQEKAIELINRFSELYAFGANFEKDKEIVIKDFPHGMKPVLKGNYDNHDFNNYYIELKWPN